MAKLEVKLEVDVEDLKKACKKAEKALKAFAEAVDEVAEQKIVIKAVKEEPKKYVAEIDDTTAFGVPHHNHDKHRVYISRLSYNQALWIQTQLNEYRLKYIPEPEQPKEL